MLHYDYTHSTDVAIPIRPFRLWVPMSCVRLSRGMSPLHRPLEPGAFVPAIFRRMNRKGDMLRMNSASIAAEHEQPLPPCGHTGTAWNRYAGAHRTYYASSIPGVFSMHRPGDQDAQGVYRCDCRGGQSWSRASRAFPRRRRSQEQRCTTAR